MAEIIRLQKYHPLSIDEASIVLPLVQQITSATAYRVDALFQRIESLSVKDLESAIALESEVNELLLEWHRKIQQLGGLPRNLWTVEFDGGDGFYGWSFPDDSFSSFRRYHTEFSERKPLVSSVPLRGEVSG